MDSDAQYALLQSFLLEHDIQNRLRAQYINAVLLVPYAAAEFFRLPQKTRSDPDAYAHFARLKHSIAESGKDPDALCILLLVYPDALKEWATPTTHVFQKETYTVVTIVLDAAARE